MLMPTRARLVNFGVWGWRHVPVGTGDFFTAGPMPYRRLTSAGPSTRAGAFLKDVDAVGNACRLCTLPPRCTPACGCWGCYANCVCLGRHRRCRLSGAWRSCIRQWPPKQHVSWDVLAGCVLGVFFAWAGLRWDRKLTGTPFEPGLPYFFSIQFHEHGSAATAPRFSTLAHWHTVLPRTTRRWNCASGSSTETLTQRLIARCGSFRVECLHQHASACLADERDALACHGATRRWSAKCCCAATTSPWSTRSHTVLPPTATAQQWPHFASRQTARSLGTTLFQDPQVQRSCGSLPDYANPSL